MTNVGVSMAGGTTGKRREDDFYPTPPEVTQALMYEEADYLYGYFDGLSRKKIWEPACGDGAIAKVVQGYGFEVISTDLRDRGYGLGGIDFLKEQARRSDLIITNPPFNLAAHFIRKGRELGCTYRALLLKSTFFHAQVRYSLFCEYPPARVYPLLWRPDFTGQGASTMECSWFVWDDEEYSGHTHYIPLPRPGNDENLSLFKQGGSHDRCTKTET